MAERSDYQPEDIDCFYFQYKTHCIEEQCRFLHRESCKLSDDVCPEWHHQKKCTNSACPQKHLNRETLKTYFLCDEEKQNNYCEQQNCHKYHDKVSNSNEVHRSSAIKGPVLADERRVECNNNLMVKKQKRTQFSLKSARQFFKVAVKLIQTVAKEKKLSVDGENKATKEILHTILFLCLINQPSFEPQALLKNSMKFWAHKFPDVFEQYRTHLPTRPPYTILLEVVVDYKGSNNIEGILDFLSKLNKKMIVEQNTEECRKYGNGLCFVPTVISCCFFQDLNHGTKTDNYFGASVSCFGKHQKEIMIDILCYRTWNKDISLAVCMALECQRQAIEFRPKVHSVAYPMKDISNTQYTPIPPCSKCLVMFPDIGNDLQQRNNKHTFWQYGNCAEVESLSRLLNAHGDICMLLPVPPEDKFTRRFLLLKRKKRLVHNLKLFSFQLGKDLLFYKPFELQNMA